METLKLRSIYLVLATWTLCSSVVHAQSGLSFEKFYRVNTPTETTSVEDWLGLQVKEGNLRSSQKFVYQTDLDMRFFYKTNAESFNYSLSEAYILNRKSDESHIWGRKIVHWNPHEKYWMLGQLNGNQGFRLLSTKQEGLLGYHYKYRFNKQLRAHIFVSYFHIPSMNPQISIEDGKVKSNSEWNRRPPSQTIIADGTVKDIYYEMNSPKMGDILFNKSLGMNLAYHYQGAKIQVYSVYKPEPKLRVNAEALYDSTRNQVVVTANPIVNHHVVMGTNISKKFQQVTYGVGIQVSDPNARLGKDFESVDPIKLQADHRTFNSEYLKIEPNYDREAYLMGRMEHHNSLFGWQFHLIELLSSNERGSDDFYSETAKWQRALGAAFHYNLTDSVLLSTDYRFDLKRRDQVLSFSSNFHLTESFSLLVGGELIKAPNDNSYWSAYRANDSFHSLIKYYF